MGRIHQLDAQTANMIAAGEVVERPMGVVKELVENAIDAGSTRISVAVEQGGIEKITVSDNGCGMDAADAELAFERHATSKIRSQNDLWDINTLGFRGEALPSIASVSKFTLTTSDGRDSTRVQIEYGEKKFVGPYPINQGTEIVVEGLFYRTPARLKHLRTGSYENSLIQNIVIQFALSHPEIAFTFISNGKESFRSTGNGDLQEVVYLAWGREPAENIIPVSFSDYDYTVSGVLVKPHVTRASKNFMHIFLNGRMVRTYRLYKAVTDAYEGIIAKDRMPMCVLNIEMDPHLLDVNVHPSKWEVRLSKENQLEYLILDGVRNALLGTSIAPSAPIVKEETETAAQKQLELDVTYQMPYVEVKQETSAPLKRAETKIVEEQPTAREETIMQYTVKEPVKTEVQSESEEYNPLPAMRVIGQFRKNMIVLECEQGIALIDQQAALSRIAYENIQQKLGKETPMMDLLVPYTFDVTHDIVARLDELNACLKEIPLTFESFGHATLLVRSIPVYMKDMDEIAIQDLIEDFINEEKKGVHRLEKERIALTLSHRMKKRQKTLSADEMNLLVQELSNCKNPYTTSDGKTIFVILDEKDLWKAFRK